MRIVVALGGNALLPRGMELTMAHQREAVRAASGVLAEVAAEHELVITHGNGPQVGLLAMQAAAYDADSDLTLDVLDAESAGMVGYVIEQELGNRLPEGRGVVTVLTTTLVARDDPAFARPDEVRRPGLRLRAGPPARAVPRVDVRPDGIWYRRVVPSPAPVGVEPRGADRRAPRPRVRRGLRRRRRGAGVRRSARPRGRGGGRRQGRRQRADRRAARGGPAGHRDRRAGRVRGLGTRPGPPAAAPRRARPRRHGARRRAPCGPRSRRRRGSRAAAAAP